MAQEHLDGLWDFTDPVGSEARLRAAVAAAEPGPAAVADADELRTQVARSLGLQDRFSEGDAVLDEITSPFTGALRSRCSGPTKPLPRSSARSADSARRIALGG